MEAIKRMDDLLDGRRTSGNMHINDIYVDPNHNARNFDLPSNRAKLEELKQDILNSGGVLVPLFVRFDAGTKRVTLVDGERRYRAVKELNARPGAEEILVPVVKSVEKLMSDEDALVRSISTNTGKPFEQWEVGKTYARLKGFGWTDQRIADRFAKSERYVRDAIDLNEAPADVKTALDNGEITVAVALDAIRKSGSQASQVVQQKVQAAKSSGKGKVVAQYTKRNLKVKIDTKELRDIVKVLSKTKRALKDYNFPAEILTQLGEFDLAIDALKAALPTEDADKSKAAKELTDF